MLYVLGLLVIIFSMLTNDPQWAIVGTVIMFLNVLIDLWF